MTEKRYLVFSVERRNARRLAVERLSAEQLYWLVGLYLHEPYGQAVFDGHHEKTLESLVRKRLAKKAPVNKYSLTEAGSVRVRACLGGGKGATG